MVNACGDSLGDFCFPTPIDDSLAPTVIKVTFLILAIIATIFALNAYFTWGEVMKGHYIVCLGGGLFLSGALIHVTQMIIGCCVREDTPKPKPLTGPGGQIGPQKFGYSRRTAFVGITDFVRSQPPFFLEGKFASIILDFCGIKELGRLACTTKNFYECICGNTEISYVKENVDNEMLMSALGTMLDSWKLFFPKERCISMPTIPHILAHFWSDSSTLEKFDELQTVWLKSKGDHGWEMMLRIEGYNTTTHKTMIGLLIFSEVSGTAWCTSTNVSHVDRLLLKNNLNELLDKGKLTVASSDPQDTGPPITFSIPPFKKIP